MRESRKGDPGLRNSRGVSACRTCPSIVWHESLRCLSLWAEPIHHLGFWTISDATAAPTLQLGGTDSSDACSSLA